jgi:hypothetical protein
MDAFEHLAAEGDVDVGRGLPLFDGHINHGRLLLLDKLPLEAAPHHANRAVDDGHLGVGPDPAEFGEACEMAAHDVDVHGPTYQAHVIAWR